ncbi:hypothetical protein HOB91_02600 [Candidatus Woesearchaeota archaeon]|nr:hypothetical protein [Candidatus Woesearchaeota archaeon]
MNILFVCTQGQNRSKYLAEYLKEKGYSTDYGGVKADGANPLTQEKVDWADVIVAVREHIKDKFLNRFELNGKELIQLEVQDNSKGYSKEAQELSDTSWYEFQKKYVYPNLRKQIEEHISKFKKRSI